MTYVTITAHGTYRLYGDIQLTVEGIQNELTKQGIDTDWEIIEVDTQEDYVEVYISKEFDIEVDYSEYEPTVDYDEYGNSYVSYPDINAEDLFYDNCELPKGIEIDYIDSDSDISYESLFGHDDNEW